VMFARKFKRFMRRPRRDGKQFQRKDPPRWKDNYKNKDFFKGKEVEKEENDKDEIICYECKKPGHVKSRCPKLNNSKAPYKDKRFKKKAMMAAWGESDLEDSDEDEEEANEVSNLCLMAKEDEENEVQCDSYTHDELQLAFDDLVDEFKKLGAKNSVLKKMIISMGEENEFLTNENMLLKDSSLLLKNENDSLKKENEELKTKVEFLDSALTKFNIGEKSLNQLLGSQRFWLDKSGIGYDSTKNDKSFKNAFVKSVNTILPNTHPHITCHYCRHKGHYIQHCPIRKERLVGVSMAWVPKGESVSYASSSNMNGPKMTWVPKVKS
jgi:hypothetical protein